jgi:methylase of polypeptide subunit release factors
VTDTPRVTDPEALARLRAAFQEAGYTATGIRQVLGADDEFRRDTDELPFYLRQLDPKAPLSTLVKLFLLHVDVPVGEARAAGIEPAETEAMGLVRVEDGAVRPLVEIVPVVKHLVACDQTLEHRQPNRPDHVPGPTPPTNLLSGLTPRIPARTAFDVGVGNAIQSLALSEHTQRIVGTDVSRRALAFAEFNAALNEVTNLELREGSLFEPVAGESFDLVVSNPPYIISPDASYLFRDSGLEGHSFCEALVRGAPAVLAEGGIAVFIAEWGFRNGEDWPAPLVEWVDGNGCDALLLSFYDDDALHHAAEGNERLRDDPAAYAAALDRWTAYCRTLGYDRIGWGAVILRKRSGRNWIRAESPSGRVDWAGHHVLRLLENQDQLERSDDDALLDRRLVLADDHRLEQTLVLADGRGVVRGSLLRLAGGLEFKVEVDGVSAHVLSFLDGSRSLREVLEEVAATAPQPVAPEALARGMLPGIRRLLELGLLVVPAGDRAHSAA